MAALVSALMPALMRVNVIVQYYQYTRKTIIPILILYITNKVLIVPIPISYIINQSLS